MLFSTVASLKVPVMIVYDVATKVLDTELFPQHTIANLNSGITFTVLFSQEKPFQWKKINTHKVVNLVMMGNVQLKYLPFNMYISLTFTDKPLWLLFKFPDIPWLSLINFKKTFFLPYLPWLYHSWLLAIMNDDIKIIITQYTFCLHLVENIMCNCIYNLFHPN